MIKLNIQRYRDFTKEENDAREEWKGKNNNYGMNSRYDPLTPLGVEKYFEGLLEVEITNGQFDAIRKAVLDQF